MTIDFGRSGQPKEITAFRVVELSILIELIQWSIVQLMVQGETILMTPEQTVQLINLLGQKRKESKLSINEVARRANVDTGTVWRIEQGMIATPRAESLIAIGGVLGIPSADLFATVGWLTADELPTTGPYLRTKYSRLPDAAIDDVENHITTVLERYDADTTDDLRPQHVAQPKEI